MNANSSVTEVSISRVTSTVCAFFEKRPCSGGGRRRTTECPVVGNVNRGSNKQQTDDQACLVNHFHTQIPVMFIAYSVKFI